MVTAPDRLHLLYEINRRLTTFTDLDELVRFATHRTREVFEAEGCALLLLDRQRNEFYFPIASQSAARAASQARLAEIRFPSGQGIAGWVLSHDEAAVVADAATDPRFYRGVDEQSGFETRTVLCAPLRTRSGNIGVIEVVNPGAPSAPGQDIEFLETLASDIAIAHDQAQLYERLRGEALALRQVLGLAGLAMLAIGVLFGLGAIIRQLAQGLPMSELTARPGMWLGVSATVGGLLLTGVAGGWFVGKTAPRP